MLVSRFANWLMIFFGALLLVVGSAGAIISLAPANLQSKPDAVEAALMMHGEQKSTTSVPSSVPPTPFSPKPGLPAVTPLTDEVSLTANEIVSINGGEEPVRLVIPSISLHAPVIPAKTQIINVAGSSYTQWLAPDRFAAGWHSGSARLGMPGNTVLNGHHNIEDEVFGRLVDVALGDQILVYSDTHVFHYVVANKMILPEKYQNLDVRMDNARWILSSDDERLTLITCWPKESNTHRLILVASPVSVETIEHLSPLEQGLVPEN